MAALATVLLAALPALAGAAPSGDSTSGNVTQPGFRLDWHARGTAGSLNAHGNARVTFTGADPNQTFSGDVTCLQVVGATDATPAFASVGVLITQTPPGQGFAQGMIIEASDSGKFSNVPDTAQFQLLASPPPPDGACPLSFGGQPVTQGEVVINNEFP
jgi:hypothetical protein